jgi:hypothetical protein
VAALVALIVGLIAVAHLEPHVVEVRGASPPTVTSTTPPTADSSTTTTAEPTTTSAPDRQLPPVTVPPTPASQWQVSATSALTNLAAVTITATGLPPGRYYVGQCPTGVAPTINSCVLQHTVTVTDDGTFTSTVDVFWRIGGTDCSSAQGACLVGVMDARSAVVVASYPIAFDLSRAPTISVSPRDSLTDGESVSVHGVDVGEGQVDIEECLLPFWDSCNDHETSSGPDGSFTTVIPLNRSIDWYSRSGPIAATCGDSNCGIIAFVTPNGLGKSIPINLDRPVTLKFTLQPTTTTTTITTPPSPAG